MAEAPTTPPEDPRMTEDRLIDAALLHVPFDGWSEATLRAAAADTGVDLALARALYPRGAVDLALAFHRRGDRRMAEALAIADLCALRFRDKVAEAVRLRLRVVAPDKEAVRRGVTLFSLPQNVAAGAGAIWGTADAIWTALGDTSRDYNWYTKRATLSAVWSSTVLYWLGDDSPDMAATAAFIDRRIGDVMAFESVKGRVLASPFGKLMEKGPMRLLDHVRAPDDWRSRAPGFLKG
jgi:ubiquinone biosynthesis protein COQ9